MLSPLLLFTAIAIKLNSQGPVLVREARFGNKNQTIHFFKFRFVEAGCEQRLSRIGRSLHQTGIEELCGSLSDRTHAPHAQVL
jgi:polysaccharide biosynthesis protein PslA